MSSVDERPRVHASPSRSPRKRTGKNVREAAGKVLGLADIAADTTAAFIPPVSAVGEVKDVIKEALKLPAVKKRLPARVAHFLGLRA